MESTMHTCWLGKSRATGHNSQETLPHTNTHFHFHAQPIQSHCFCWQSVYHQCCLLAGVSGVASRPVPMAAAPAADKKIKLHIPQGRKTASLVWTQQLITSTTIITSMLRIWTPELTSTWTHFNTVTCQCQYVYTVSVISHHNAMYVQDCHLIITVSGKKFYLINSMVLPR